MPKTLENALVVMLALSGLTACSADVGERGDTLRAVDEQAMVSQLLYMRLDVSPFPMTAADLEASGEDATLAVPIRVEVFDEIAVAWFAPGGVARVNRSGIIAVWRVENRTPTGGELDNDAEIGLVVPGGVDIFLGDPLTANPSIARPEANQTSDLPREVVVRAIIDFFDILNTQDEARIIATIGGYHPGCL